MAFEIEALFRRTDRRRGETFVVIVNDPPLRHQCLPVLQRAGMIASDLLNHDGWAGSHTFRCITCEYSPGDSKIAVAAEIPEGPCGHVGEVVAISFPHDPPEEFLKRGSACLSVREFKCNVEAFP